MMEQVVEIFTDGSCSGNPGPGGWGVVLRYGTREKELHGGERPTTNNRMELMAAIRALESLTRPVSVRVYTDSRYVCDGMVKWVSAWRQRNWRTSSGKPVNNIDLWLRLISAAEDHDVQWHWVRGHSGHPENERADRLARLGVREVGDES
jgi:ribonuclease HI